MRLLKVVDGIKSVKASELKPGEKFTYLTSVIYTCVTLDKHHFKVKANTTYALRDGRHEVCVFSTDEDVMVDLVTPRSKTTVTLEIESENEFSWISKLL